MRSSPARFLVSLRAIVFSSGKRRCSEWAGCSRSLTLQLRFGGEVAFVAEGSCGSVPAVEFPQEVPHDHDHGTLSRHGDTFVVVVLTIKAVSTHQRSPLLGNPILSPVGAGLSHTDVETGVV
jgi:hypothetical protein